MNRRDFLLGPGGVILGACLSQVWEGQGLAAPRPGIRRRDEGAGLNAVEARFYRSLGNGLTECLLCPNACSGGEGFRGVCGVRETRAGKVYSLVYGRPAVTRLDDVEKSPLYHYRPGLKTLSLATAGCNLKCDYCQNWEFSQQRPEQTRNYDISPRAAVEKAKTHGAGALAYFYTEPIIYFEYATDCAHLARQAGLANLMITAGYVNEKPLRDMCKVTDAFAFGLKGFNEKFYEESVGGSLAPVLKSLDVIREEGVWLEIGYLIVPTLNDDMGEIGRMARWIKDHMGQDTPLHFLRFVPKYKLKHLPPTPRGTLERAWEIARGVGLKYVYLGNVPGHSGNSTYCPRCGKMVIMRLGTSLRENRLQAGKCPHCGMALKGRWS